MKLVERDQIGAIYTEIHDALANDHGSLVRPESQDGRVGFAILYTPRRHRPDLLIVGQNPGNFGPNGSNFDHEANRTMMSGQIPTINSYIKHKHDFAITLQGFFAGPNAGLLRACVGMNLWFFQARGTPRLTAELKELCESRARRVIRIIEQRTILCLSARAFDALKTEKSSSFGVVEAPCWVSHFEAIPMIRAHHPTGSWARRKASTSIPAAIKRIKAILASSADSGTGKGLPASDISPAGSPRVARPLSQRSGRIFRITRRGRTFLSQPGRETQLRAIMEVLDRLGSQGTGAVHEGILVQHLSENPVIQRSMQAPRVLLNWYRTHRLLTDGLVEVNL